MDKPFCKDCGNSDEKQFRWGGKLDNGAKRFRCKQCGTWGNMGNGQEQAPDADVYSFVDNGQTAEATAVLDMDTIKSPRELAKAMSIDENIWEIYKKQVGKQAAWRKDREVIWKVKDGQVIEGNVRDSGKIKVVPLFSVKYGCEEKQRRYAPTLLLKISRRTYINSLQKTSP